MKKILTMEDLVRFCSDTNLKSFCSKDYGYQLAVRVPSTIERFEEDTTHEGMLKLKIKIFHTGRNRNNSFVSKESAQKAMSTIADRPILAAIHQLDDGTWDFESHEMEIVENEDGDGEIRYIESQVGSFSSEPAFWEHDDELDKDFVCAYAYIPREYTKAAEIIERKSGTKNSCELCINEMSYSSKEKCLELKDFYVAGSTLLGSRNDGTEIQEGMLGSRADIADFASAPMVFNTNDKLIEAIAELKCSVDQCVSTINNKLGGTDTMDKLNELLAKYEKTIEELPTTYEWESMTPEQLEQKFSELFDDDPVDNGGGDSDNDDNAGGSGGSSADDEQDDEEDEDEGDDEEEEEEEEESTPVDDGVEVKKQKYSVTINGVTKEFELSLNEKIQALTELVNGTYSEADNAYYCVQAYEDYVVMVDYWTDIAYRQAYSEMDGVYSLGGERVQVYHTWLTAEEGAALDGLKKDYERIIKEQEASAREAIFSDSAYEEIANTDEFIALKKDAEKFSVDDISTKADAILGRFAKAKKNVNKVGIGGYNKAPKKATPYGSLF